MKLVMKILLVYPMWTGSYTGVVNKYFARKSGGVFPPINLALLAAIAVSKSFWVSP